MNLKANEYAKRWNLSDLHCIAETPTSHIYETSRGKTLILKVFTDLGIKDEGDSVTVLKHWQGRGAVKIEEADAGAILMERLHAPNLYTFSESDQETNATEIFAKITREIHSNSPKENPGVRDLISLFEILHQSKSQQHSDIYKEAWVISQKLLDSQKSAALLHGDLHHENIMKRETGEFVCFDPKGIWGDPAYELATVLKNPWDFPQISENEKTCLERATFLSKLLDYSLDRVLAFAFVHMCMSALWAEQDGGDSTHQMAIAGFLQHHLRF